MTRRNGKKPALDWFKGLDKNGKAKVFAAATLVEHSLRSGRPSGQRVAPVEVSKQGLLELRVTPPGGSPPHLRVLFKRKGQTLWAATGFTKQKNHLERKEVKAGDQIVKEWERK
jgi:hypothetical protein